MPLIIHNHTGQLNHIEGCNVTITPNGFSTTPKHTDAVDVPFEEVCNYFPLLTKKCVQDNRVEQVEAELRAACKGTAPALWKTIHFNETMGYLATADLQAAEIYRCFEDYFGKLPYTDRNFRDARSKS